MRTSQKLDGNTKKQKTPFHPPPKTQKKTLNPSPSFSLVA